MAYFLKEILYAVCYKEAKGWNFQSSWYDTEDELFGQGVCPIQTNSAPNPVAPMTLSQ